MAALFRQGMCTESEKPIRAGSASNPPVPRSKFPIPSRPGLWLNEPKNPMSKTKVALLGAGFIADIHIESYHRFVPDAEVVAVFTRTPDRAQSFATRHRIRQWFSDLDKAIADSGCDVVDV